MTKPNKEHQVYELDYDVSHLVGDIEYDAWLVSPECRYLNFNAPKVLCPPERIEFETVGEYLFATDYPYTRPSWPIMSKRMLETLLSVGEFPHQVIPVVMLDTQLHDFQKIGAPPEEIHDFVAVQLLEHLDVLDWERSMCERHPTIPNTVEALSMQKLVLKEPEGGFPPLFRIASYRTQLYVSAFSRAALEKAGLKRLFFPGLRGSWLD